ncbi:MAG: hypothetical protein Q4G60_11865 [bacterium]|nr:hypothetical protein [bacterium]
MPGKKKVSRIIQTLCVMAVVMIGYLAVMPDVVKAETHTFDLGTNGTVTIEDGYNQDTIKIIVSGGLVEDNIPVTDKIVFKGGNGSQEINNMFSSYSNKVTYICFDGINISKLRLNRDAGINLNLEFINTNQFKAIKILPPNSVNNGGTVNIILNGVCTIDNTLSGYDVACDIATANCVISGNGSFNVIQQEGQLGLACNNLRVDSGTLSVENQCASNAKAMRCMVSFTQNGGTVNCKANQATDGTSTALWMGESSASTTDCTINNGILELSTGGGSAPIIKEEGVCNFAINPPITYGSIGDSKATAVTKTAAEITTLYNSTNPVYHYLRLPALVNPTPSPSPTPTPEPQKKEEKEEQPQQSNKKQEENPDVLTWSYPTNPSGILVVKEQQGFLCRYAMKAATPFGYREAFSFNMLEDGKTSYNKKTGTFTLGIPTAYQKSGRIFAIIGIDRNGNTKVFTDLDTSDTTFTTTLDMEGYAFLLIYTDKS